MAVSSASIQVHGNEPLGNPFNTAIVPEISDRPASSMTFWQRFKNTIFVKFVSVQSRYYINVQNDIVKKHFGPEMPDIVELERDISLMLINSHQIFHGVRPLTPAVVEIAGIHIHDDGASIPEASIFIKNIHHRHSIITFFFSSFLTIRSNVDLIDCQKATV